RIRCSLPVPADVGQVSLAGRTVLGEQFIAPIAVVADRRRRDKRPGLTGLAKRFGSGSCQNASALHAAVADLLFELLRPVACDVLARKMHYRIAICKLARIERLGRIPLHLAFARSAANQRDRRVTCRRQGASQRLSNQSRSAADEYTHEFRTVLQAALAYLTQSQTCGQQRAAQYRRIIGHGDFPPTDRDQRSLRHPLSRSPAQS